MKTILQAICAGILIGLLGPVTAATAGAKIVEKPAARVVAVTSTDCAYVWCPLARPVKIDGPTRVNRLAAVTHDANTGMLADGTVVPLYGIVTAVVYPNGVGIAPNGEAVCAGQFAPGCATRGPGWLTQALRYSFRDHEWLPPTMADYPAPRPVRR